MRLYKRIFLLSLFITILTLILSIVIELFCNLDIKVYLVNVLIGLFSAGLILICTSLLEYHDRKKRLFEEMFTTIVKFNKEFIKIKYFFPEEVKILDANQSIEDTHLKQKVVGALETYQDIANLDIEAIRISFEEIDFIFHSRRNKKIIEQSYYLVFKEIIEKLNQELNYIQKVLDFAPKFQIENKILISIQNNFFTYTTSKDDTRGKEIFLEAGQGTVSVFVINNYMSQLVSTFAKLNKMCKTKQRIYNAFNE